MKTSRLALCLLMTSVAAHASPWPRVNPPPDARVETIGEQIRLNGIPMHMARIRARSATAEMLDHYREALGKPVAHAQVADTHVLSQRRGNHFITVSINATDDGLSEALLSIADMQAARQAADRPLAFRLPAGSEILSDLESVDGPISARQLVLENAHTLRTNLEQLSRSLADRGLTPDGPPLTDVDTAIVQGFHGPFGEARLVLVRHDGSTRAVLTLRLKRS